MQEISHYLWDLSFLYGHCITCETQVLLDLGYLLAYGLDEEHSHLVGAIYIIMCIVPSPVWEGGMFAWGEDHV